MKRHVGIDLGTTHVAVAYAEGDEVRGFALRQLVGPDVEDRLALLPSVLHSPVAGEVRPERLSDGWLVGELARTRAAETSGRSIASAKSWLSYAEVDRTAAILPWQLDEDEEGLSRLSPIDAQRLVLEAVRRAWDDEHPEAPLADQRVVLTVPASFDAVARELTVRAARDAGLSPSLLEEPQAAFLDWIEGGARLHEVIPKGHDEGRVLVVDVGGGTTDLSLVRVRRSGASFAVERMAVGRHLLLGGDNMDLTLAYLSERRLQGEERLPARRFAELVAACRRAKERLLADDAPETATVTLLASGAKLLGGARAVELPRDEVRALLCDGFFPRVPLDAEPIRARAAVVAFGLPYERDVAITRHVAAFVRRHGVPTAVLLNGGVFHATALAERLVEVVRSWTEEPVASLAFERPDTAVARGAVRHSLALAGRGARVRAGASRSYLVGVAGTGGEIEAVGVLPRGADDGASFRLPTAFELVLGRTVRFALWSADVVVDVGQAVPVDALESLPSLVATLPGEGTVTVELEVRLSAVGTLELACLAKDGRRFELSFELRHAASGGTVKRADQVRASDRRAELAGALLTAVFGKGASGTERDAKQLIRELERLLGKRETWDGELCRALFDRLFEVHKGRRQSVEHERAFFQLAGYTLRPGAGAPRDPERAAGLFRLFEQRLAHGEPRSWQQFWIAWRRIAAGLDDAAQRRLRDVLDPELAPPEARLKRDKGFRNDASAEMLELAACLERAGASRRAELGGFIVERTWTTRDPRLWSALGRVGGRLPAYASAHHVVRAAVVEKWLDHLVREKWEALPTASAASVSMCRLTGDRDRDVAERTRALVDRKLASLGLDEAFRAPLHDVIPLRAADQGAFFGDELPAGLRALDE
ncbi:MAG: Hsp70 family protein [Deltaproteobacteria bacterium]|nr:Hsp70 family protein [Deltaproteobacteria bacterium]